LLARFVSSHRSLAPVVFSLALLALLPGCKDMSARDYYIFGTGSASRPATQPPQQMPSAAPNAAPSGEAPGQLAPAPPAPIEAAPLPAPAAAAARPVVGLLLPLSGPNAALGRALLDAASLAAFDIADESFVLVPRDTGGTADGAAAAAQAALAAGAKLIIGPLFGAEVPSVASVTRPASVNIISLSNDRAVAGPGVFVLGLSPQGQVERVVGFARSRGLQSFAALIPSNNFGAAVEDSFRSSVAATGGQVAVVERYDPSAGDATPVVRRLAAYGAQGAAAAAQRKALQDRDDDAAREQLRQLDLAGSATNVGFNAVLLPDFGDRLLSIAPLLPYYDIDPGQVRFLGSALWEDPRVTREPALVGGWFAAPPPDARADFTRRYRSVYGQAPPRIATLVYDATALAAVLARGANGPDFSADAVANPNGFAGTDGIFRFRADGTAERGLAVLEVERDGFRVISPAPEDFRELTR
jgi:branched-chain amino acid transport system substrate-binding protein